MKSGSDGILKKMIPDYIGKIAWNSGNVEFVIGVFIFLLA